MSYPKRLSAVAVAAMFALTGCGSSVAAVRSAAHTKVSAPLWQADPSKGLKSFEGVETKPGAVTVVNSIYGKAYRFATSGIKIDASTRVRVESRGQQTAGGSPLRFSRDGDVFYVGWRSMWGPLPTKKGNWVVLWQLKDYGSGAATPPLSIRARGNGQIDLEYADPALKTTQLWSAPLTLNHWNSFVIGFKVSKNPSKGWVQFWYNGKRQTLTGGTTQFKAATLRADFVTDKWGVYRSDGVTGAATAWLSNARVGLSYASVAQ
jgi:hypothetical protein